MANPSRTLSIFLLKPGEDAASALDPDHPLEQVSGTMLPPGATMFVLDAAPREPWWKAYFGLTKDLKQSLKGSIVFLPVKGRVFALTFGHVWHQLDEERYEHDFGIRVTLNSVDPVRLKNTDTVEPGASRRQRTQLSVDSDLTFFDFDRDSKILRSLSGVVREEYEEYFRQATGAASLKISTKARSGDLVKICTELLALYESDDFLTVFPEIQNISPVKDPVVVAALNELLLERVRANAGGFSLAYPGMIDYDSEVLYKFAGGGASLEYDDLYSSLFYEYLDSNGVAKSSLTLDDLKRMKVNIVSEDGHPREGATIFKALISDVSLPGDSAVYHLSDGDWYRFEGAYVDRVRDYLDARFVDLDYIECRQHLEEDYNRDLADDRASLNLDKSNVSPRGSSQVEPCDVLDIEADGVTFNHVKISTASEKLSHLFNQGVNSVTLLLSEPEALEKLRRLVEAERGAAVASEVVDAINAGRISIRYVMITHKPHGSKSENLPLFSRVSLMRAIKELELLRLDGKYGFVTDVAPARVGKKRPRKKRTSSVTFQTVADSSA